MKHIMFIIALALVVSAASAQMVSSSDPQDPFPAEFYTNKYAVPPDAVKVPSQFAGVLVIHSPTSPLTQVTNDHDYWPVVATFYNVKAQEKAITISLGSDSEFADLFAAGDYEIAYRYCKVPVKVDVGKTSVVEIPVCDR